MPTTVFVAPTCEAEIKLRPPSATFHNCQTFSVKTIEPTFIYLETAREWIYSLPSEQPLKISCPNETYETRIHGLGIFGMRGKPTSNSSTLHPYCENKCHQRWTLGNNRIHPTKDTMLCTSNKINDLKGRYR